MSDEFVLLIDDVREMSADVVARNFDAGIEALVKEGPFDLLLLDHDLGHPVGEYKTGYDILCWLERHLEYLPKRIQLITMNPVGRARMQVVLDRLYPKKEK